MRIICITISINYTFIPLIFPLLKGPTRVTLPYGIPLLQAEDNKTAATAEAFALKRVQRY